MRSRKIYQLFQSYDIRYINRNSASTFDELPREMAGCLLVLYILIYFDITHFDDEIYRKFRSVVDP